MYKRTQNDIILRITDGAAISPDTASTDYQGVLVWLAEGNTLAPMDPPTPEQVRETQKAARAVAVAAITVTVGDKVFDGDELSQTRMARAIIGMQAASAPTITWTLADNSIAEVTVTELTTALILAGQEQAALWPIP